MLYKYFSYLPLPVTSVIKKNTITKTNSNILIITRQNHLCNKSYPLFSYFFFLFFLKYLRSLMINLYTVYQIMIKIHKLSMNHRVFLEKLFETIKGQLRVNIMMNFKIFIYSCFKMSF